MRIGISGSCTILAIALTLGGVSIVKAQQPDSTPQTTKSVKTVTKTKTKKKTSSSPHISVTKESGGEVVPTVNQDSIAAAERARQDSINAARQDSIQRAQQMQRDSIAALERQKQDSIERARHDSIARAELIAHADAARRVWIRRHGGWYAGVAAGASIPTGAWTSAGLNSGGYSTGFNMTVPVGYDFPNRMYGLRLDGTFDQHNGKNFNANVGAPNLLVWGLNLDLRLRTPVGNSFNRFYVLGGGSWAHYSGFFTDFANPNNPTGNGGASHWGWNVGGGFNYNWKAMTGLFVESRYIWLNAESQTGFPFSNASWVPIVVGLSF